MIKVCDYCVLTMREHGSYNMGAVKRCMKGNFTYVAESRDHKEHDLVARPRIYESSTCGGYWEERSGCKWRESSSILRGINYDTASVW